MGLSTRRRPIRTAIIIPCLNEARTILRTARSLGFGPGAGPQPDRCLILVDNGSRDGTAEILARIREARAISVYVAHEAERGYVPPRHRGILIAGELAQAQGLSSNELLLLQADGDTVYEPGYVAAFEAAAAAGARNVLFEGGARPPPSFSDRHAGFQRLADEVDASISSALATDEDDVIVDDKVAGFTLATYIDWGGHRREFNSHGHELHAETARLFIRGRLRGGRRVRVPGAVAQPSRRKILCNPIRHFATAGFPREEAWWRNWSARYAGPRDLQAFEDPKQLPALAPAIATRRAHLFVLLGALPLFLARAQGLTPDPVGSQTALDAIVAELTGAPRDPDDSLASLFERVFDVVDALALRF